MRSVEVIVSGSWAGTGTTGSGHTTGHTGHTTTGSATSSLVNSHHDGVVFSLDLLLLGIVLLTLSISVGFAELKTFSRAILDDFLVIISELSLELLVVKGVSHLDTVGFKSILGLNLLLDLFVLALVFLGFVNHTLDLLLGETTLIVGDSDLFVLSGSLV